MLAVRACGSDTLGSLTPIWCSRGARNPKNTTKTTGRAACTQLLGGSADNGLVMNESLSQRRAAPAIGTPVPSDLDQIKSTMAELIIDELEQAVVQELHARAARHGVSPEEELRAVLREVRQSRSGVRLKQVLLALNGPEAA